MEDALQLLAMPSAPKRRQAAKRLRKNPDPAAGPLLLRALEEELPFQQRWETQYHLIMALGQCHTRAAVPLLQGLAEKPLPHMVLLAVGDALFRLLSDTRDPGEVLLSLLDSGKAAVAEGALRGAALLRVQLTDEVAEQVVDWLRTGGDDRHAFWAAAGAAGWAGQSTRTFLTQSQQSSSQDTRRAAEASLNKRYLNWKPL